MYVGLRIANGSNSGRLVKIPISDFIIGRHEGCHLRLKSDAISRKHCVIKIKDSVVYIRDLKSRNGTFINGERLEGKKELKYGDVLKIGKIKFQIVIEHGVGGVKKEEVKSPQEAAARAAKSEEPLSKEDQAGDSISSWLEEADEIDREKGLNDPDSRHYKTEETERVAMPKEITDTISLSMADEDTKVEPKPKELGAESEGDEESNDSNGKPKKQEPGKLPMLPGMQAKDSQDAASRALKDFFNRR